MSEVSYPNWTPRFLFLLSFPTDKRRNDPEMTFLFLNDEISLTQYTFREITQPDEDDVILTTRDVFNNVRHQEPQYRPCVLLESETEQYLMPFAVVQHYYGVVPGVTKSMIADYRQSTRLMQKLNSPTRKVSVENDVITMNDLVFPRSFLETTFVQFYPNECKAFLDELDDFSFYTSYKNLTKDAQDNLREMYRLKQSGRETELYQRTFEYETEAPASLDTN